MYSKLVSITALLCLISCFFSCKDDVEPSSESPFFDFFNEALIQIDTIKQSADSWEYGFAFTPLKNGKVTQFGIKLPDTGDFTVTLWDLSGPTPSILHSKSVNSLADNQDAVSDIPEVALNKGQKYGITVLSNSFYRITRPGNAQFNFPRVIGNIRIESFQESVNNTNSATFPATTNDTRVAPCVNVIFIAD